MIPLHFVSPSFFSHFFNIKDHNYFFFFEIIDIIYYFYLCANNSEVASSPYPIY